METVGGHYTPRERRIVVTWRGRRTLYTQGETDSCNMETIGGHYTPRERRIVVTWRR